MEAQQIKIGDIVRHRHILKMTDLFVFDIEGDILRVRYGDQGLFQTQELFMHEVALYLEDVDEDEYL